MTIGKGALTIGMIGGIDSEGYEYMVECRDGNLANVPENSIDYQDGVREEKFLRNVFPYFHASWPSKPDGTGLQTGALYLMLLGDNNWYKGLPKSFDNWFRKDALNPDYRILFATWAQKGLQHGYDLEESKLKKAGFANCKRRSRIEAGGGLEV